MKRSIMKVAMGQHKVQEVVRIEGDEAPGPDDGTFGFRAFWEFITSLQTNPTLLRHSVECPIEVVIKHTGHSWIVETKALVDASIYTS
jgi:hypothetical protein